MKDLDFTVPAELSGSRLDRCLSLLIPDSSRTYLQSLIKENLVSIDGKVVSSARTPVKTGMVLHIKIPEIQTEAIKSEPFQFEILFESPSFLVINKPAGVVVHPAAGNPDGTVVNALLGRYPQMAETFSDAPARPGIVHRLDKDTSGCLVIAKHPDALFKLSKAFAERQTGKTYLAISRGVPQQISGELKNLIGRHPVNRQKMAIVERNGKVAHTAYQVIAQKNIDNNPLALVKVKIFTGRTHQIRVHLSSIGLPIVGDTVYGNRHCNCFSNIKRQLLHAWQITLPDPDSGEILTFTAPIPEDFSGISELIKQK